MWRANLFGDLGGTVSRGFKGPKVKFDGVKITDKDSGLIYEVAVTRDQGRVNVVGLTILAPEGQRLQDLISTVPTHRLAEQAALYLAATEEREGVAQFRAAPLKSPHDLPTWEQIAEDFLSLGGRAPVVRKYAGVMSEAAVDERIRKARDAKRIPERDPQGRGRPRKPPEPTRAGTYKRHHKEGERR